MEPKQPKRIRWTVASVLTILVLLMFVGFHWGYFFPLRAHTDLRFQLTGELIALTAYGLAFASRRFFERNTEAIQRLRTGPAWYRVFVYAYPWAIGMVAFFWRDGFAGHEFRVMKFVPLVLIWSLGGWLFGFLMQRAADNNRETEELAL
jgi:hypothetical protein